jgi:hypothetical protein
MKRTIFILSIFLMIISSNIGKAQSIGFSYLFPSNGYFSHPIAPVHINLPLKFNNFFQISPGISLQNIGGMSMSGFGDEYKSDRALVGPFQSFNFSVIPTIVIPTKYIELELMGGAFGFLSMNKKLMTGNFNDMLTEAHSYTSIQSDLNFENHIFGWGYVFGAKLNFYVRDNIWGYISGKYYIGNQAMPINGIINYTSTDNQTLQEKNINFPDALINYQGFEISIGGSMRKK